MQNYTTILGIIDLRLRGISYNDTCARYGVGHSTVTHVMRLFKKSGKQLDELKAMNGEEVEKLFYPPENIRRKDIAVMPDFEMIHKSIAAKGSKVNLFFAWLDYKREIPSGYQYTQFCHYYKKYLEKNFPAKELSMAVERKPGEKVYIDWVGDKPEILIDRDTGEVKAVHVFVTTIGVSSYIYAEVFIDEKLPSFIAGTVHALQFYGGVPKFLVPDNVKTAVKKHDNDQLILNSVYQDLERFYDTIVLPPPPYKPKGKSTVEGTIKFLETHLIEELKKNIYYSIEDINARVKQIIAEINSNYFRGKDYSRKDLFEQYDKPQLRPLADGMFSPCDYKYFSKVPNNYHLEYDDHYYSVLYTYFGEPVILKATVFEIKICDKNNKLICTHDRLYERFPKYSTINDHMPSDHRFYSDVNSKNGDYYRRWAKVYGPYMEKLIDTVLMSFEHEEQAYKSCSGILHYCTDKPEYMVKEAARLCVESNACKYSYFNKTLKNFVDGTAKVKDKEKLPEHKNIRGKDAFK